MKKITRYFLLLISFIFSIPQASFAEELWKKTDRIIDNFCLKLAKNYNLKLLLTGCGNIVDSHQGIWDMSLLSHEQLTLEDSRKLAVSLAHDFLTKAYNDPLLIKYMESLTETTKWRTPPALQPSRVGIKLAFWDKNFERVPEPYIAQVLFHDEKFEYFKTNSKDQNLILLHSESMEDAFNMLSKTPPQPLPTTK